MFSMSATKKNPPNPVYFCPSTQKDTVKCLKLRQEHIWCVCVKEGQSHDQAMEGVPESGPRVCHSGNERNCGVSVLGSFTKRVD